MKVGLLIYGDINTLSGGYLYDRKLVSYLQQQGDTVEIISIPKRSYLINIIGNIKPQKLLGLDIDILVQDELVHPSVYRTNQKLKIHGQYPIVSLVHLLSSSAPLPLYKEYLYQRIEQKYLTSVDGLILNSNNSLEQAQGLVVNDLPPCIVAVPAGDNFEDGEYSTGNVNNAPDESGPLKILYVGAITRQKGLDVLIRSLARIKNRNFHLTVTGRSDMEPSFVKKMKSLVKKLHLQNRIKFTGPMVEEALVKTYQSHDVLVLPSVNEAYGIVYVEAQRFGLPVIGTTAGGAKEIINHGENGYLIIPNYDNELAYYLSMLQQDRALLQKLSNNAYQAYQRHPSWEDSCSKIRQFLMKIISNEGSMR